VRKTQAVRVDAYGQDGDQFRYPYSLFGVPLSPRALVSVRYDWDQMRFEYADDVPCLLLAAQ
jgi:hypothetical protein